MLEWQLDLITTGAITIVLVLLGYQLKHHVRIFERFCIPVAVIGGFIAAILILFFRETGIVTVHFDTTLQMPAMVAFFTTIGLGGSIALIKHGGRLLFVYLVICWLLVMFQDIFGASMANMLGVTPILGVMAGGVSLSGGHGTAVAFGSMAEGLGVQDAITIGLACATFGLIVGGVLGGPIASYLIKKHKLQITPQETTKPHISLQDREEDVQLTSYQLIASAGLIAVLMVLGFWVSELFTGAFKIVLPSYVGAMFVAIIFRNLNDQLHFIKLNNSAIDVIADISLGFFLTQAMMSLKIWDLYALAFPLLLILVLQVLVLVIVAVYIVFPLMGRNYDAAVMCSGLMGHGLGAVPNAVANMSAVCGKYQVYSYKALLIVPLCGAFLLEIVGVPFHVWIINYLSAFTVNF